LQLRPYKFSNQSKLVPGSPGKKGRDIAGQIPARGGVGGGEELAHEHQELKARLLEVLGRGRDDQRWGSHGGPKWRRRGDRRQGVSRQGRQPSSGPVAAAGGEKTTGVVGLVGEGAKGWVQREQKLTGEEVATVRWFLWESGREEWPGSVSGVRGSSPGGCSGAGRAGVSCPRRTEGRRSGGRGRRCWSGLGVCAAREREGNGRGMS
jgi:hypothetical protein